VAEVKVNGIAQVALTVSDLDEAKAFYGERLGLAHLFNAEPRLTFFQAGATRLMLSESAGRDAPARTILYYGVEDVAAAHAALAPDGGPPDRAPRVITRLEGRDVWLAFVEDGAGNLVGLING
jgi:predicted enzyme related to lactoylglutathione lyase